MRTKPIAALLFAAALVSGPLTATAAADTPSLPTETGCPAGEALTLDFLREVGGYRVPFIIDAEGTTMVSSAATHSTRPNTTSSARTAAAGCR